MAAVTNGIPKHTAKELEAASKPANAADLQGLPDALFDTVTYPTAGGITDLIVFDGTSLSDPTWTNVSERGLDANNWFVVERLYLQVMSAVTSTAAATVAGAVNDLNNILRVSRAVWRFTIKDKSTPWVPLHLVGCKAPIGGLVASQNTAVPTTIQMASTPANDGWPFARSLVIPPQQAFQIQIKFKAGAPAVSADTDLQFVMAGYRYRPLA